MTVTRIAPSPTGYAHIGTMRTALFNWLYAKHHGGEFRIRIEDTDKDRNVNDAIQPIIDGMAWLGIIPDGDIVYQSNNAARHRDVAHELLARGAAYRCYMTTDEIDQAKIITRKTGMPARSPWRDRTDMPDLPYTIRLRMPDHGTTTINDMVQGEVSIQNNTLDDMILLRSDGSPTYMLAVVVDDHDMAVDTVLRGDDHLTNTFRQIWIYRALRWSVPSYGHIPLIHDESGKKLSKRTGAAGIEFYQQGGFVPEAVFNYMLRMGWGHGDHEMFTVDEAIDLFDIDGVGKSSARLDIKRLEFLNGEYLREYPDDGILTLFGAMGKDVSNPMVRSLVPLVKVRSKTLVEAWEYIAMSINGPTVSPNIDSPLYDDFVTRLDHDFSAAGLRMLAEQVAQEHAVKLKHVVAPIRLAITGSKISPPLFEVMELLGEKCVKERLRG